MYFVKDEIIELNDNKKYLVIDNALIDEISYYKIIEVSSDDKNLIGDFKYINVENNDGKLFIYDVNNKDIIAKLEELFN